MRRILFLLLLQHLLIGVCAFGQITADVRLSSDPFNDTLPSALRIQSAATLQGRGLVVWGTRVEDAVGDPIGALVMVFDGLPSRLTTDAEHPVDFVAVVPLRTSFLVLWNESSVGMKACFIDARSGEVGEHFVFKKDDYAAAQSVPYTWLTEDGRTTLFWNSKSGAGWTRSVDLTTETLTEARLVAANGFDFAQSVLLPGGTPLLRISFTTGLLLSGSTIDTVPFQWQTYSKPFMMEGDTIAILGNNGLEIYTSFDQPTPHQIYPGIPTGPIAGLFISRDSIGYFAVWSEPGFKSSLISNILMLRFDEKGPNPIETLFRIGFSFSRIVRTEVSETGVIQGCGRVSSAGAGGYVLTANYAGGGSTSYESVGFFYRTDSIGRLSISHRDDNVGAPQTPATSCRYPSLPVPNNIQRLSFVGESRIRVNATEYSTPIAPIIDQHPSVTPLIRSSDSGISVSWFERGREYYYRRYWSDGSLQPVSTDLIRGEATWTMPIGRARVEVVNNHWTILENLGRNDRGYRKSYSAFLNCNGSWMTRHLQFLTDTSYYPPPDLYFAHHTTGYDPERSEILFAYDQYGFNQQTNGVRNVAAVSCDGTVRSYSFSRSAFTTAKTPEKDSTTPTGLIPGPTGYMLFYGHDSVAYLDTIRRGVTFIRIADAADSSQLWQEEPFLCMPLRHGRFLRAFAPSTNTSDPSVVPSYRLEVRSTATELLGVRLIPANGATGRPVIVQNSSDDAIVVLVPGRGLTCHYLDDRLGNWKRSNGDDVEPFLISRTTDSIGSPTGVAMNDTIFAAWEDRRIGGRSEVFGNVWAVPNDLKRKAEYPGGPGDPNSENPIPWYAQLTIIGAFPNPVLRVTSIGITSVFNHDAEFALINALGKEVYRTPVEVKEGYRLYPLDLSTVDAGSYLLQLRGTAGSDVIKVVVIGE